MITFGFYHHSRNFIKRENIPDPIFVSTNCEKTLICTLQDIIHSSKYTVSLWHINKNVLTNCKPLFNIKETL